MNSAKIQKNMFCAYIIVASSEKLMLECLHRFPSLLQVMRFPETWSAFQKRHSELGVIVAKPKLIDSLEIQISKACSAALR